MPTLANLWRNNKSLIAFIFLMVVFRSAVADWNSVPSGSMLPTIREGDRIFVDKMAYDLRVPLTHIRIAHLADPQRGDIVTIDSSAAHELLVKRIVAIPGDSVSLVDNVLYVNGVRAQYRSLVVAPMRDAPSSPGYYVKPTVLTNVRPDMKVVREEIFGPVLVAQQFEDLDDLAALANDTIFGLGASVWSNDIKTVQRLVPKIRAGTVWVNCHNFVDPNMPFGGFKQSGFGREHGRAVLDLYTELKSVCMAY